MIAQIMLCLSLLSSIGSVYAGSPGMLDTGFNSSGANPGFLNLSTELATRNFSTPSNAQVMLQNADGSYFIAVDDDSVTYITKMTVDNVQDADFAVDSDGIISFSGKSSVAAMLTLQSGNIAVVGGTGSAGWIMIFDPITGLLQQGFAAQDQLDGHYAVAQQSNGRIIVAGIENGVGTLLAYNSVTGTVDKTFGNNGRYAPGYTCQFNTILVDADDHIYIMVAQNSTNYLRVLKLTVNAVVDLQHPTTEVIWEFDYNAAIVPQYTYLTFDIHNNIVIGAMRVGSFFVLLVRTQENNFVADNLFTFMDYVSSMRVDSSNCIIFTGYNHSRSGLPFVARTLSDGTGGIDRSFGTSGYASVAVPASSTSAWNDVIIRPSGQILAAGMGTINSVQTPYLMALFGTGAQQHDASVAAGVAGTLDTNFITGGVIELTTFDGVRSLDNQTPMVVLPTADGYEFIAFGDGDMIRLTNGNALDYNYGILGFVYNQTPGGTSGLIMDGQGRLVAVGTNVGGYNLGWVQRYQAGESGVFDSTFNNTGIIDLVNFKICSIVQQSCGRYLVTGQNSLTGNAVIFAYNELGFPDTTFNAAGRLDLSVQTNLQAIATDEYDRIVIATRDSDSNTVLVTRFTPTGQVDTTFNEPNGAVVCLNGVADEAQIFITFDNNQNIVVAAQTVDTERITVSVVGIDTLGNIIYPRFVINFTSDPTLTNLQATADGCVLLGVTQSIGKDMRIIRLVVQDNAYTFDTTFNPDGFRPGVASLGFDIGASESNLQALAIYPDGQIAFAGTETNGTINPFLSRLYNTPYTTRELQSLDAQPIGSNDYTFGIKNPPANGFEFFAFTRYPEFLGQAARAIALQDDQNIVVAVDGQQEEETDPSLIYLNVFDVDGLLNPNFNSQGSTPGQIVALSEFENQYVRDMMTMTDDGIYKALLTGYVTSRALNSNNSLLMQYILGSVDSVAQPGLDETFGGYNGDSLGVAIGENSSQGFTLLRQSTGRIIVAGFDPVNNVGLIQAYTPSGKLDQTFGQSGYFVQGASGIYASVIDSLDRIIVGYSDDLGNLLLARILSDGSGLDATFGTDGVFLLNYGDSQAPLTSQDSYKMVLDQDGNIFVAAILLDGTILVVDKMDQNAQGVYASTSFTQSNFGGSLYRLQIGSLLINQDNNLIFVGSDQDSLLIAQITTTTEFIQLDPAFNPQDTPGYIRYNISADRTVRTTNMTGGLIHPDGRYIVIGHQIQ